MQDRSGLDVVVDLLAAVVVVARGGAVVVLVASKAPVAVGTRAVEEREVSRKPHLISTTLRKDTAYPTEE